MNKSEFNQELQVEIEEFESLYEVFDLMHNGVSLKEKPKSMGEKPSKEQLLRILKSGAFTEALQAKQDRFIIEFSKKN